MTKADIFPAVFFICAFGGLGTAYVDLFCEKSGEERVVEVVGAGTDVPGGNSNMVVVKWGDQLSTVYVGGAFAKHLKPGDRLTVVRKKSGVWGSNRGLSVKED